MKAFKDKNLCIQPTDNLSEFIDRFKAHLKKRGHTRGTRQTYVSAAKHFYYYLRTIPRGNEINKESVQRFLQDHLPFCCCPEPVYKDLKLVRASLNQVLSMEGYHRFRPDIGAKYPYIEAEIDRFDNYLKDICGHADATRWYHRRNIRAFLIWLFRDQCICVDRITAECLCRFVADRSFSLRNSSLANIVYSLRAYLRFLQLNGLATPSLEATIPRPPNWSKTSLLRALNQDELNRFWSVFDLRTPIGKRDYAVARCLTDLGLRCHEVASIQLESIDWRNSVLHLPKTKSRRHEALPIPGRMARALIAYLSKARPQTKCRSVFVYHRAPVGRAVQNTTVRGIIRRAFVRAELPWSGTHILRSTIASQMLEGGASIKEVADVLRHRSIDTTISYTRINFTQLAQVALPWPGRLS